MVKQGDNGELMVVSKKEMEASKEVSDQKVNEEPKVAEQPKEAMEIVSSKDLKKEEDTNEFPIPDEHEEAPEVIDEDVVEETKEEPKESITIQPLSTVEQASPECPIGMISKSMREAGLESILTDEEEAVVDGYLERAKVPESTSKAPTERVFINKAEESSEVRENAVSLLDKFKEYVTSNKFDEKCEVAAEKHGVDKRIVKNKVIAGFLGTVANTLGLTLTIGADVITSAVNFVAYVVNRIVEFAVDNLKKVVKLLTLNCGEIQ